jgi:hypothetical protein
LKPHAVNFAFAVVANVTAVLSLIGILLAHRHEAARALERAGDARWPDRHPQPAFLAPAGRGGTRGQRAL